MATAVETNRLRFIDWSKVDLYRFFAYAFGPPSVDRHDWFSQPGVNAALAELWEQLGCEGDYPGIEWYPAFESYEAAYIAIFDVGVPEPPIPLFESAHDKSRPAQELVLENTYFYDVLGLRVDPALSVPDHLITQLEFLSAVTFAREEAAADSSPQDLDRLEREFLERHVLNWTAAANKKMKECQLPAFKVLFGLMSGLLRLRHNQLAV
jgi:DMSO reductase family type II enzyme chaperone